MTVFEILALIICIILVVGFVGGVSLFFYVRSEQKKAFKEFKNRTGRKF